MAKKQTFGDKVGKQSSSKNHIKLIRSGRAPKTGALRFYGEMVRIPDGKNADALVKELLSKNT